VRFGEKMQGYKPDSARSAEGVLAECASCVSSHTCSEIATGACDIMCNGVDFSGEPTREENAGTICTASASAT
jgi:hypothetical protein